MWDANAPWWDERFGEGNAFQTQLIGPATEHLLALRLGETVLNVSCGNGAFARRMVALDALVVAVDFSERFLEVARAHHRGAERIEYRLVDATDEAQLLGLGQGKFDAAVCTMALMDMAEIEPVARALSRILKPNGRFVFSPLHPCFNSSDARLSLEEENRDGQLVRLYAVKVTRYAHPWAERGIGIRGQPTPQIYFNRPPMMLLDVFFAVGFVLDAWRSRSSKRQPRTPATRSAGSISTRSRPSWLPVSACASDRTGNHRTPTSGNCIPIA